MLNCIHGTSQAHNHRPCLSTGKPHIPEHTAKRGHTAHGTKTPHLLPTSAGAAGAGDQPGLPHWRCPLFTPVGTLPFTPSPPARAARLACHSKPRVTWREPPVGPGTSSLSLPHYPSASTVPLPTATCSLSLWCGTSRGAAGRKGVKSRFFNTAQQGSSKDSHFSPLTTTNARG